jgi:hypothetical protein
MSTCVYAANPLIWRQGICDPHIHIYNGKAYLYATHDNPGQSSFNMTDWKVYSSPDLVNWTLESTMYPSNFYCGPITNCWATDAAYKNGKYYWYFSDFMDSVGVGVSDSPGGPFTDALGRALVSKADTAPTGISKWDPCCFIDDDGTPYLICGAADLGGGYLIAKLNDDMISLAEPFRNITCTGNPRLEDKPSIHKYNGIYYLTHSSFYATSTNVYGPYTYRGNTGANVDHGSYFTFNNQTYSATGGMDNPSKTFRASFLAYCHYKANGEIVVDQKPMEYGVGQYDASWDKIEAEWYFGLSGSAKKEESYTGGFVIGNIKNNDYLYFQNVNNVEANSTMDFYVSSANVAGGTIEVHEGSPSGTLLGSCTVPNTGSWTNYTTVSCNLNNMAGVKQIYLVFKGDSNTLLNLDWFAFNTSTQRYSCEAETGVQGGGAVIVNDTTASCSRRVDGMGSQGAYITVFPDGGAGGSSTLKIKYANNGATAYLSLYVNGVDAQKLAFPNTGRWNVSNPPAEISVTVSLKPGVNTIKLQKDSDDGIDAVNIDNFVVSMPKTMYKTYAAGNGLLLPADNGCWVNPNTPQRQCEPYAFSSRYVTCLNSGTASITLNNVDGGSGGLADLVVRYCSSNSSASHFNISVNGVNGQQMTFTSTGSWSMSSPNTVKVTVSLNPGKNNTITFTRVDGSINVDAFSIVTVSYINSFSQIEAENFNSQSGIQTESCSEGGLDVGYINNGDWTEYNNVDFGSSAATFNARVASNTSGGNIEVRLDSATGTLIGTCAVSGTGGWQNWTTVSCNVSGATGVHNLYLVFKGGSGYLFNFNWFKFN